MSNPTSLPWQKRLFAPINISPLVYFRMAFGAIMLWEVWRYFDYGWIERYYIRIVPFLMWKRTYLLLFLRPDVPRDECTVIQYRHLSLVHDCSHRRTLLSVSVA